MASLTPICPIGDCVLLRVDSAPDYATYKAYTHVVVPEAFQHGPEDRPQTGQVLAKGPACHDALVRVMDHVVIGKWAGMHFTHQQRAYLLIRESDILAVLT